MVGILIRLKFAMLRHAWHGGQSALLPLGAWAGLAFAAWTWYSVASAVDAAAAVDVVSAACALWTLVWLALPITGGAGGDPLRPDVFRLLPNSPRRLALGLLGASGVLATVGMILLVPQGIVPLIFSFVAPEVRSWFIALYLPHAVQVPVSVLFAILGGLCLAAAWRMRRVRARRLA